MLYSELQCSEAIHKAVERMGFAEMTEIQEKTIPVMMAGHDVIAKAPTGTGKTCAFGIPVAEHIDPEKKYPQAVIMAPTRELAQQIAEELTELTMDLHASQIQGFFDIPLDHLQGNVTFVDYFMKKFPEDVYNHEDFVVVSPDVGSVARARNFASKVHMGLAIVDKRRPKANVSEVMNIIGDVKDKNVILLDDIIDTAGSLCGAANALKELGGAKEIYACASHGVLSGPAIERIEKSAINEVLFLDTIPENPEHKS